MVAAFEKASERKIPYNVIDRRAGDIAEFTLILLKQRKSLAGRLTKELTKCVVTLGNGNQLIQKATSEIEF
jgi:UDP-glucose 4-epimerase